MNNSKLKLLLSFTTENMSNCQGGLKEECGVTEDSLREVDKNLGMHGRD